jgi:hypothetical protein
MFVRKKNINISLSLSGGIMVTTFGSPKPYGIKGTIIQRHIAVVGRWLIFVS